MVTWGALVAEITRVASIADAQWLAVVVPAGTEHAGIDGTRLIFDADEALHVVAVRAKAAPLPAVTLIADADGQIPLLLAPPMNARVFIATNRRFDIEIGHAVTIAATAGRLLPGVENFRELVFQVGELMLIA